MLWRGEGSVFETRVTGLASNVAQRVRALFVAASMNQDATFILLSLSELGSHRNPIDKRPVVIPASVD
jgi:hypothetical protein